MIMIQPLEDINNGQYKKGCMYNIGDDEAIRLIEAGLARDTSGKIPTGTRSTAHQTLDVKSVVINQSTRYI